jgi:hypothetical protein
LLVNVGSLQEAEATVTVVDLKTGVGEHVKVSSSNEQILEEFVLGRKQNAEIDDGARA